MCAWTTASGIRLFYRGDWRDDVTHGWGAPLPHPQLYNRMPVLIDAFVQACGAVRASARGRVRHVLPSLSLCNILRRHVRLRRGVCIAGDVERGGFLSGEQQEVEGEE